MLRTSRLKKVQVFSLTSSDQTKKTQELGDVTLLIHVCLQNNFILLGENAMFCARHQMIIKKFTV